MPLEACYALPLLEFLRFIRLNSIERNHFNVLLIARDPDPGAYTVFNLPQRGTSLFYKAFHWGWMRALPLR